MAARLERAHAQLLGQGEGLAIVANGELDLWMCLARRALAQKPQRPGLEANMPERGGQGQGTLAVVDGVVKSTRHPEIVAHLGVDPPEPQGVAQRLGEGFGATQVVEYTPRRFCQGNKRIA